MLPVTIATVLTILLKQFLLHPFNPNMHIGQNMADLRQKNIEIVGISFAATILDAMLNI